MDHTIGLLNEHDRRVSLSKREIGKHIFDSYFGGNEALTRSGDVDKPASFRLLAERAGKETRWSKHALYEAVIAHLVASSLRPGLAGALPFYLLTSLDAVEGPMREILAEKIARGELRGDRAVKAISAAGGVRRGGPRPRPAPLAATIELEKALKRAGETSAFSRGELGTMARAGTLDELAPRLAAIASAVQAIAESARAVLAEASSERPRPAERRRG